MVPPVVDDGDDADIDVDAVPSTLDGVDADADDSGFVFRSTGSSSCVVAAAAVAALVVSVVTASSFR